MEFQCEAVIFWDEVSGLDFSRLMDVLKQVFETLDFNGQ